VRVAQGHENSINATEMVPQRCLSLIGVVSLQRLDNGGMLIDQLFDHVRHWEAELPNAIQVRARPVEQFRDARMTARCDQFAMERLIESVELLRVGGDLGGSLQCDVLTQAFGSSGVDAPSGCPHGRAFQSLTCELSFTYFS
jgi:hypothetical protein